MILQIMTWSRVCLQYLDFLFISQLLHLFGFPGCCSNIVPMRKMSSLFLSIHFDGCLFEIFRFFTEVLSILGGESDISW